VIAMTAHSDLPNLVAAAQKFRPRLIGITDEAQWHPGQAALRSAGITAEIVGGSEALLAAATLPEVDTVLTAVVGAAGLPATLAAAQRGKRLAIANKEPLVMAGDLIMRTAQAHGATILPVDSEHAALHQCLACGRPAATLTLTASGGALRDLHDLSAVTPEQALQHPTWEMGSKITIDSASLINKALEVIEAHHLFDFAPENIQVLIHPQSIVHAMVSFTDGTTLAHLGAPDMREPIHYALTYPNTCPPLTRPPDWTKLPALTFDQVDPERWPSIELARQAMQKGSQACNALNAANEVAVAGFLRGALPFTAIFYAVRQAIEQAPNEHASDLASVLDYDAEVRKQTAQSFGGT
jgi:1-deoxy-D-xylulose-5-phosphate reductoisomerase